MAKLEYANDEQAKEFEQNLSSLFAYVKKSKDHVHLKTLSHILEDNVKMFNRIQELENGNTDTTEEQ